MKRAATWLWPLLILFTSQAFAASDDAVIYPTAAAQSSSSSKTISAPQSKTPVATPVTNTATTQSCATTSTPAPSAPAQQAPVTRSMQPAHEQQVTMVPTPVQSTTTTPHAASTSLPPSSGKTYTVKAGDNLWRIGKAHGTTLEAIKALNGMNNDTIRAGQVLKLPVAGFAYVPPQPVPAQVLPTPTPIPAPAPAMASNASVSPKPAPAPTPVSSPTISTQSTTAATSTQTPVVTTPVVASASQPRPQQLQTPQPQKVAPSPQLTQQPAPAPSASVATSMTTTGTATRSVVQLPPRQLTYSEAQARLIAESENLAKMDLDFDESWTPPGENHSWDMDCSNTSRYLYKKAVGIELPRTASDQYYNLKIQNMAWDVPTIADDKPDVEYLKHHLRVGDLLFWENTYKPERDPPITHVTIYMGTDSKGNMLMAGSQSSDVGMYGQRRGGPNIYVFDPLKSPGGWSSWFGFVHKKGRFVAFGRPLAQTPNLASSRP